MKIGFSFSQCVQDIYDGKVLESDVFLIQSSTLIVDSSYIHRIIVDYTLDRRMHGNANELTEIATRLFLGGKIYEPRSAHRRPTRILDGENWAELIAPLDTKDENVDRAYKNLLLVQKLAIDTVAPLPGHLKNDKADKDDTGTFGSFQL